MNMTAVSLGRSKSVTKALTIQPRDMDRMLRKMDQTFRAHERRLFATEGASGGPKWKALSPAYARWKRRHARGKKIMTLGKRPGKSIRDSLTRKGGDHLARWSILLAGGVPTFFLGTQDLLAARHIDPTRRSALVPNPLYNPSMPHRDTLQMKYSQQKTYPKICQQYFAEVMLPRFHRAIIAAMKRKTAALNRKGMPKKGK